jgi:DNA-directed RNA polymerase specialized sigma24 family protein
LRPRLGVSALAPCAKSLASFRPRPARASSRGRAVDCRLLQADRDVALWSAFVRLPARDQRLLRMLVADPQPSYEEIGTALAMPIGSIGPTRGRALRRLRRELELNEGLEDLAA